MVVTSITSGTSVTSVTFVAQAFCEKSGIRILPYGALAGGLLSDRYLGAPPPEEDYMALETRSLVGPRAVPNFQCEIRTRWHEIDALND